jgi:hypothetical protein
VAEWLNAAVFKFARQYSHLIQINNLTAHGTTSKWGVLGGLGERFVQRRLLLLAAFKAMKEQALAKATPPSGRAARYHPGAQLLGFLNSL